MPASATVPHQNLEAEENVLGAMLISANAIDAVLEEVAPSDFYRQSHASIFKTALAMHEKDEKVDAITLTAELTKLGLLKAAGGKARIFELAALVPATANAPHYARIIHEMATLRGLTVVSQNIARLAVERPADTPELVDRAMQYVFDLSQARSQQQIAVVGDTIHETYRELVEIQQRGSAVIGLTSGLTGLDRHTAGFQPGNMVVIAARPSIGKTGLALGICAHTAVQQGLPVVLFSLEMSKTELNQRLLAMIGCVDLQRLRTGQITIEEWSRVNKAANDLSICPLFIDDSSTLSVADIRAKARRLKSKNPKLAAVAVDYLQLMTSGNEENRAQEVSQISRGLKLLARELDVPVLALSQLNREVEKRHDKRPTLSDLRESGSIEADADLVLMLYRDEYYHPEDTDEHGIAEVHLAKHRNGPTGLCKLAFVKRYARFSDLAA